ncbi:hypothetical protein QE152_g29130 [Popillia japonica]|uniref:Transposase n=1 Tax=Popillia japonica TaxID=7064 RepID=A0AAW1JIW0_POPJA
MIAIDNEPLSIVDHHVGFKRLINNVLPHAVLNMAHFPESHTSENIKRELLQCVTKWDIPITKIQAIVHDNGANMVKGVKETLLPSERCFIHTLLERLSEQKRAISVYISESRSLTGASI